MTAAKRHGRDGKGGGGVDGYLEFLAARHPKIFAGLLGRLLPAHIKIDDVASGSSDVFVHTVNVTGVPHGVFLSREEIEEIQRREMELPPLIEHEAALPSDDDKAA